MKCLKNIYFQFLTFAWTSLVHECLTHEICSSSEDRSLILSKTFSNPQVNDNVLKFNVTFMVQQKNVPKTNFFNISLTDWCLNLKVSNITAIKIRNNVQTVINAYQADNILMLNLNLLEDDSTLKCTYEAETKNVENFTTNAPTYYPIYFTYFNENIGNLVRSSLNNTGCCISRTNQTITKYLTNVGLIIGMIIIGIILGVLFLAMILFIYVQCANKKVKKSSTSSVLKNDKAKLKDVKKRLIFSKKDKDGLLNLQNVRNSKCDESLLFLLTNNDAIHVYRSIDELDVYCATQREEETENMINKILMEGNILLVKYLENYNAIKDSSSSQDVDKYRSQMQIIDAANAESLKKANSKLFKKLYFKNKREVEQFLKRCREEKDAFSQQLKIKHCSEATLDQLLSLMDQQHEFERNDLIYRLKLEQEEEIEKLRKSFSLNKRNQCRELGTNFIKAAVTTHSLKDEQTNWLMKEQQRIQQHLTVLYDDEMARQRMLLDEKLETRRILAKTKQLEDENSVELFNTLAAHQLTVVQKSKRNGSLTPEQFDFYTKEIQDFMLKTKTKSQEERLKQESALSEELSQRKKKALEDQRNSHKEELNQFLSHVYQQINKPDGMLDPTNYLEKLIELSVRQQDEIDALQLDEDKAHVTELLKLICHANTQTEALIEEHKTNLLTNLQHEGMSEDELTKLLKQHHKDVEDLRKMQKEDEDAQKKNLEKKLAQRRKQFEIDKIQEAADQREIRNHDVRIIHNLLDKQVTINDKERETILKEHAINMTSLENSLTLGRLRKKILLNETIAQRRAKKMERLQAKQMVEIEKQSKKQPSKKRHVQEEDSDVEDDVEEKRNAPKMELLRKHIEQQLICQQNEYTELESEMDSVRQKLLSERIDAMTAQEERLASQISLLQIEKAKELARIEEQKVTLGQLKMNLMQDLNDRGYLSDDKCRAILSEHMRHQELLQRKLEEERIDKEKILKERLQQRMMRQEEQLLTGKKQELKQELQLLSKKDRAIFEMKSIVLEEKQFVEVEKFRNRIERECNQSLQEMRREFDLYKQSQLEEEEMKFVSGLVRLGLFTRAELLDVLRVLFPLKTTEQLEKLFINKLCGEDIESKAVKKSVDPSNKSNLLENTKLMRIAIKGLSISKQLRQSFRKEKKTRLTPQNGQMQSLQLNQNSRREITPIDRPDPIGGRDSPEYSMSNFSEYGQTRGSTLPPIESRTTNFRQKRATQVRPSVEYDYEI